MAADWRAVNGSRSTVSSDAAQQEDALNVDVSCAKTSADAISLAAAEIGWNVISRARGASVIWAVSKEDIIAKLQRLRAGQRLARIPGVWEACSKTVLASVLQAREANFWPQSWSLPNDSLEEICADAFANGQRTLIIKPASGSQGQGISIARKGTDLVREVRRLIALRAKIGAGANEEVAVQAYIDPPLLLGGYKWDARVYLLIIPSSERSVFCFLAREGLARVCVDPYEKPDNRNLHKLTVHLTNYSMSKFSDKYDHSGTPGDAYNGGKRTLAAVLERLQNEGLGLGVEATWQALGGLARETAEAMLEPMQTAAWDAASWESTTLPAGVSAEDVTILARDHWTQCFHILGLDVLLDETGKPWLLETNNNPSLSLDEVQPIRQGASIAESNAFFAEAKRNSQRGSLGGSKWGRPCRCAALPRPHTHELCSVDAAVKVPVVAGALTILSRAGCPMSGRPEAWAEGTIYDVV